MNERPFFVTNEHSWEQQRGNADTLCDEKGLKYGKHDGECSKEYLTKPVILYPFPKVEESLHTLNMTEAIFSFVICVRT